MGQLEDTLGAVIGWRSTPCLLLDSRRDRATPAVSKQCSVFGRSGRAKSDSPIGDTAPRQPTEEEPHRCHDAHAAGHSPAFKAKVALEAIRGEQPLIAIAERFDVHPKVITKWKRQLLEGAPAVFGEGEKDKGAEADTAKLHAKIGELTMECGLSSGARGRGDGPSARR